MKMRNSAGVLKSPTAIHMRNSANVLKAVPTIHMRNAANGQRVAYSSVAPVVSVAVTPANKFTSSATSRVNASDFTATFGSAPSSITWILLNVFNCTAAIISGQGTATARVQLTVDPGHFSGHCSVKCVAVIGGSPASDIAFKQHDYTGP